MQKLFFHSICLVMVLSLLLAGCSDFDEMKSKRQLSKVESLLQEGKEAQAEEAINVLIARYPGTQSADDARRHLHRLRVQRDLRERQVFGKILDSYQQVLNGYRALYDKFPPSLAALDASGYFFDSAYLEEITPDGYRVYLFLQEDGSGYRAWCVAKEGAKGYAIDAQARSITPFAREDILKKIKARFQEIDWTGKLVALQPRS